MRPRHSSRAAVATAACLLLLASLSAPGRSYRFGKPAQCTLYIENDLVAGTDSDYTSGFRWAWVSRAGSSRHLRSVPRAVMQAMPVDTRTCDRFSYGLSFMQRIFTPGDISSSQLVYDDRPYAGWSGFGFSVHAENLVTINSLGLSLGIVGPLSFARAPQDWFHGATDQLMAQGWRNQLDNEPTINAHFSQVRRLRPLEYSRDDFGVDTVCGWEVNLGNLFTDARGCAYVRCGYNLTYDLAIQKAEIHSNSRDLFFTGNPLRREEWTVFVVFGVEGRWSAYNVFLDGTSDADDHYVDKSTLSGDLMVGLCGGYEQFRVGYLHSFRSREFASQAEGGQQFGSLAASWTF